MMHAKSGHHAPKLVQFCSSSSFVEPTFHKTLKSNVMKKYRNPDFVKSTSLPSMIDSHSERKCFHERRRCSLPLIMSTILLTLHYMNWREKSSDCYFLEARNKKSFSLSNVLLAYFNIHLQHDHRCLIYRGAYHSSFCSPNNRRYPICRASNLAPCKLKAPC